MTPEQIQNWIDLGLLFAALPARNFLMEIICEKHSCGTVACIAGWAVTIPALQAAGFSQNFNDGMVCLHGQPINYHSPKLAEHFGVSNVSWDSLTNDFSIASPLEARQVFRTFCPSLPPL